MSCSAQCPVRSSQRCETRAAVRASRLKAPGSRLQAQGASAAGAGSAVRVSQRGPANRSSRPQGGHGGGRWAVGGRPWAVGRGRWASGRAFTQQQQTRSIISSQHHRTRRTRRQTRAACTRTATALCRCCWLAPPARQLPARRCQSCSASLPGPHACSEGALAAHRLSVSSTTSACSQCSARLHDCTPAPAP